MDNKGTLSLLTTIVITNITNYNLKILSMITLFLTGQLKRKKRKRN